MKSINAFIVITVVVLATLSFTGSLSVNAESSTQTIIGQITMVAQDTLRIREDATQVEYVLRASPDKLRGLVTGYRAKVDATNGQISSLTILGMPMRAESQPFQKWMIIKVPQG